MQGRITNKAQLPLKNTIIIVESEALTTDTDIKGTFSISLPDTGVYNICCTAIGYQTKNITLNLRGDSIVHIFMDSILFDFDSIVLVKEKGYYIHPVVFEQSILASKTYYMIKLKTLLNLKFRYAKRGSFFSPSHSYLKE